MKLTKRIKQKLRSGFLLLAIFWLSGIAVGHAQDVTINGNVTDDQNQPLPGASVLVKGTTNGTQTDFDGNYTLETSSGVTLVFSYLGFTTQEIPLDGRTTINVPMAVDASQLEEVVVVGYGTQKKSDLTGAIATVGSKDIEKYTYNDASQALQGRMAGVSVQAQGGAPGAGSVISIRGTGTLSDSGPLFVIDGMITGNMSSISPSDIASVSVLKDASATAIYGSRAANGVVIVTTKKGVKGKVTVDFDQSYGVQQVINTIDWADARQYADIVNRADDNDGADRSPANDVNFDPNYSSNLYDETFRSAGVHNTNIRISGGGENTVYSLSLNNFDQEGIVKYSDFKRTTVRANANVTKGRFKLENTIGLTRTVNNPNPYFNKERNLLPTIRLRNDAGEWSASDIEDRGFDLPLGVFYGQGTIINELALAALEDRTDTRNTLLGNIAASYEILDGLTYKLSLGMEYYNDNNYTFTPQATVISNGGNKTDSELSETNTNFESTLVEHTLNYKKAFGDHTIDLIGGFTEQENKSRSLGVNARRLPSNDIRVVSAAEEIQNTPQNDITTAIQSYFGRINYTYDDRYLLTASLRRDGSSLFKEDLRWGTFPSVALGWNISNEQFMESFDAITNIKLRGSYGEIGSNNVSAYSTDPVLNLFGEYILGVSPSRVSGYSITNGVNPFITWETTKTTDIGLEFTTFNSKLNVTMDYFIKKSEDVLVGLSNAFYTGTGNPVPRNTASIDNKGFEFLTTYADQIGDFNFSVTANLSVIDNEVTSLGDGTAIIGGSFTSNTINATKTDVGQPVSSFFGYTVDGIYQTDAEAAAANDAAGNPRAGDFRFKDIDGDGDVDVDDQSYIGNPTPDFQYGFNVSGEYKGFDINLFFNGVSGNDILNGTKYRGYFDFNGNYFADALNAWTPTNTGATIPRNTQADPGFNRRMSDFYLENGSYFRLRNAQLGYSIPDNILEKIKLQKIRLYLSATNLFTITDYTGYYPEVGRNSRGNAIKIFNSGVDEGNYPTPRTFQLGLQVSF